MRTDVNHVEKGIQLNLTADGPSLVLTVTWVSLVAEETSQNQPAEVTEVSKAVLEGQTVV